VDSVTTSRPIGEQDPGFTLLRIPHRTEACGQAAVMPDQRRTEPVLPALSEKAATREPASGPPTLRGRSFHSHETGLAWRLAAYEQPMTAIPCLDKICTYMVNNY
jgi:hypothetical protein